MKRTELADVDLNLLVTCEALLETTSVTAAARRLRVTQPAVSHALARLRELLGDPLLVRTAIAWCARRAGSASRRWWSTSSRACAR